MVEPVRETMFRGCLQKRISRRKIQSKEVEGPTPKWRMVHEERIRLADPEPRRDAAMAPS